MLVSSPHVPSLLQLDMHEFAPPATAAMEIDIGGSGLSGFQQDQFGVASPDLEGVVVRRAAASQIR